MSKLTDEEIEEAQTTKTMIVQVGYDHWAMSHADALHLLSLFTRARKVEQVHTSNYRKSIWVECEDQSASVENATIGSVRVSGAPNDVDQFIAATRAVSGGSAE